MINWKRVNENLRCPICGDKAHISPETDGTQGEHTHRFPISQEMAQRLSDENAPVIVRRLREAADMMVADDTGYEKVVKLIREAATLLDEKLP